jgi:hypothetical protein
VLLTKLNIVLNCTEGDKKVRINIEEGSPNASKVIGFRNTIALVLVKHVLPGYNMIVPLKLAPG